MSTSDALSAQVRRLMHEGSLDAADAMLDAALEAAPGNAGALYLRGVIANRRGDHADAIAALRESLAAEPSAHSWLALGNAHAQGGQGDMAITAYREVLSREPSWPDAHYNLGLMLKRTGDMPRAARAFHAAWVLDPAAGTAAKQCVATLAAWVQADPAVCAVAPVALESPLSVSIAVCSIDDAKAARVEALYRRLFAALPHDITVIRDARSLAEAYNRAVAASTGDVVLLSHDDVDILAPDFAPRLLAHLRRFDAVGVAGAVRVDGPAPVLSGHPHLRGWITHRPPGETHWRADVLDPRPVADRIAVLDGVLLAARREVFAAVAFDAVTFDGFHLYDVDWSVRAAQAGFRLGVAGDLLLVHESRGSYDDRWLHFAQRFNRKHGFGAIPMPTDGVFYEALLDNPDQVRAFYARLAELAQ